MNFNPKMLQIYLVGGTQDTHHDSYEFLAKVEEAMQAGITAFQYREKRQLNYDCRCTINYGKTIG